MMDCVDYKNFEEYFQTNLMRVFLEWGTREEVKKAIIDFFDSEETLERFKNRQIAREINDKTDLLLKEYNGLQKQADEYKEKSTHEYFTRCRDGEVKG